MFSSCTLILWSGWWYFSSLEKLTITFNHLNSHSFGFFVPINKLNQIKLLKVVTSESGKCLIPICAPDMYFVWNKILLLQQTHANQQCCMRKYNNCMRTTCWHKSENWSSRCSMYLRVGKGHHMGSKELQELKVFVICFTIPFVYQYINLQSTADCKWYRNIEIPTKLLIIMVLFWVTKAIGTSPKISWTALLTLSKMQDYWIWKIKGMLGNCQRDWWVVEQHLQGHCILFHWQHD